ncbi:MAG: thiamine-phosphate kinase [Actinomycetota bacterium]|jgi:thiamine-monophosphate kinase|nr:thiamine-phosphate kinase [Rubrobacter sp.]MDQ3509686.1 thiamine-phosphate kinase [Actinomycetota bacterium]
MNEFEAIRRMRELLPDAPPEVVVPIGDDCAAFRVGDETWLAAADMLVEGRHFRKWASPEGVGYKAVAVNVSDVAAMGGRPRFVLVSGGAPEPETALRVFEGVAEACREFGVYPLGGDTTRADALTVDVSILGVAEAPPVLRSGAKAGDVLAVTGELGASAAGLLALEGGIEGYPRLVKKHLRPEPRVEVGLAAAKLGVHAMIDISDGLASDVRHISEKSGVGCEINLDLLPVSEDTESLAKSLGRDASFLAAAGGEDYELLISAPGDILDELARSIEVPLTTVGWIAGGGVVFESGGDVVENLSGWDHFP